MSNKGLIIPTIGNVLVVISIVLLTMTGFLGSNFEIESTQKGGLALSLENQAYLWTDALETSTQLISVTSAYEIGKVGGIEGRDVSTWYINGPDVMDIKAHLEDLIVSRLPSGSMTIENPITFGEGFIDVSGYDSAHCGPIENSKCFVVNSEKDFSIADNSIKAAVNLEPYRFNSRVDSNYFSLIYAGRAIMEEEKFNSLLKSDSTGSLTGLFQSDQRFSKLKISTNVSGSMIEFTIWDESCLDINRYYCLAPLKGNETGITVGGKAIPYDFIKLKFKVDTQNLMEPPTLKYVFVVKEGYGRICVTKEDWEICTIGSKQVRFDNSEKVQISAIPKSDFVKFIGIWNSQEVTISSKDDSSIPDPANPPSFPAQYDNAFVYGYFRTCLPLTCEEGSCGPKSNGCGRTLNCGGCQGGNWWCDYTVNFCKCTPSTCSDLGKECGSWSDGCGGTLSCGSCSGQDICSDGRCVCVPNCNGKTCGPDGCGGSCGTCSGTKEEIGPSICTSGVLSGQKRSCTKTCSTSGTCDCTLPSTWEKSSTIKTCTYGCASDGKSCAAGKWCPATTCTDNCCDFWPCTATGTSCTTQARCIGPNQAAPTCRYTDKYDIGALQECPSGYVKDWCGGFGCLRMCCTNTNRVCTASCSTDSTKCPP